MRRVYSLVPVEAFTIHKGKPKSIELVLKNNPGVFFLSSKLAEVCGYPVKGSQVELRKSITEMIEEGNLPIVAGAKGFAWAKSAEMMSEYLEILQARKEGLEHRIAGVMAARRKHFGGEIE